MLRSRFRPSSYIPVTRVVRISQSCRELILRRHVSQTQRHLQFKLVNGSRTTSKSRLRSTSYPRNRLGVQHYKHWSTITTSNMVSIFRVNSGKLEDGLPRLAHGATHLPTLSLAVYVSCLPSFVSSNFGAQNAFLRVLPHSETPPTFFAPGTGEIPKQSGHRGIAFTQVLTGPGLTVLHSEPRPKCLAPSTGGIQNAAEPLSPAELLSPQVLAVPKRSHNHVHNAFPQVLEGVTAESLSPKYGLFEPTVLHPAPRRKRSALSTDGIQNRSTAWRNRFPPSTGGSWTYRAGWPFPGCGARGKKYGVCQGE